MIIMDLVKTKKYLQWGNYYLHQIFQQIITNQMKCNSYQHGGVGITLNTLKGIFDFKKKKDESAADFEQLTQHLSKVRDIKINYSCNFLGLEWLVAKIKTASREWVADGYSDRWKLGTDGQLTQVHYDLINRGFQWDGFIKDIGSLGSVDGEVDGSKISSDELVNKIRGIPFNQRIVKITLNSGDQLGQFFGSILIDILHDHNTGGKEVAGPLHPNTVKNLRSKLRQVGTTPDWWGGRLPVVPTKGMGDLTYVLLCLFEFCWQDDNRSSFMSHKPTCYSNLTVPDIAERASMNPSNDIKRKIYLRVEKSVFDYFTKLKLYDPSITYSKWTLPYPPKRKESQDLEQIQFNYQLNLARSSSIGNTITGCSGLGGWHVTPDTGHSAIYDQSSNPAGCFLVNEVPVRYNIPNLTDPGGSFRTSISPSEQYDACINEVEHLKKIIIDYTNFVYQIYVSDVDSGISYLLLEIDYCLTGPYLWESSSKRHNSPSPDVRVPYILFNGLPVAESPYKMASAGDVKTLVNGILQQRDTYHKEDQLFRIGQIIWSKLYGDLGQVLSTVGNSSIFVSGDRSACALALMINECIATSTISIVDSKTSPTTEASPVTQPLYLNICLSRDFWLMNIPTATIDTPTQINFSSTDMSEETFATLMSSPDNEWSTLDKVSDTLHMYVDELLSCYQVFKEIIGSDRVITQSQERQYISDKGKLTTALEELQAQIKEWLTPSTAPDLLVPDLKLYETRQATHPENLSVDSTNTKDAALLVQFSELASQLLRNIEIIRTRRRRHLFNLISEKAKTNNCSTDYLLNWIKAYLNWSQKYEFTQIEKDHTLATELIDSETPEGMISGAILQMAISNRQMEVSIANAGIRYTPEKLGNERDSFEQDYNLLWEIVYQTPSKMNEIIKITYQGIQDKQKQIKQYEEMFLTINQLSGKVIELVEDATTIVNGVVDTLEVHDASVTLVALRSGLATLRDTVPHDVIDTAETLLSMSSDGDISQDNKNFVTRLKINENTVKVASSIKPVDMRDLPHMSDITLVSSLSQSVKIMTEVTRLTNQIKTISTIEDDDE